MEPDWTVGIRICFITEPNRTFIDVQLGSIAEQFDWIRQYLTEGPVKNKREAVNRLVFLRTPTHEMGQQYCPIINY